MSPSDPQYLAFLVSVLKNIQNEYPGNINMDTVIRSIESRIEFHNNK